MSNSIHGLFYQRYTPFSAHNTLSIHSSYAFPRFAASTNTHMQEGLGKQAHLFYGERAGRQAWHHFFLRLSHSFHKHVARVSDEAPFAVSFIGSRETDTQGFTTSIFRIKRSSKIGRLPFHDSSLYPSESGQVGSSRQVLKCILLLCIGTKPAW